MASSGSDSGIPHESNYSNGESGRFSASSEALNKLMDTSTAVENSKTRRCQPTTPLSYAPVLTTNSTQNELLIGTVPDFPNTAQLLNDNTITEHIDTHRGTSPPLDTNPIGFERGLALPPGRRDIFSVRPGLKNNKNSRSFDMTSGDFVAARIHQQESEDSEPPARFEGQHTSLLVYREKNRYMVQESKNVEILSKTQFINAQPPESNHSYNPEVQQLTQEMYNGPVSVYHQGAPNYESINNPLTSTKGRQSYDQLKPGYQTQSHTQPQSLHENPEIQLAIITNEYQGLSISPQKAQYHDSQPLGGFMQFAPSTQNQAFDQYAMEHGNGVRDTDHGETRQYNAQLNKEIQLVNGAPDIGDDFRIHYQEASHASTSQAGSEVSLDSIMPIENFQSGNDSTDSRSYVTQSNDATRDGKGPNDRAVALIHSGFNPTFQLLRERGHMAPLSAEDMSCSKYVGNHQPRGPHTRIAGILDLPRYLNCAVWIRGIPRNIHKLHLYRELFHAVSFGPIVGAFINEAGDSFSHHAAKVVFKHPEHADRLVYIACTYGVQIHGKYLHIEHNRFGYLEHPSSLHYQSRVVIVQVKNDPSLGIDYWLRFVRDLCVVGIESTRHLHNSTSACMIMEFRFARIAGQAQVLLQGIKKHPDFQEKISARYVPDVFCDLHRHI